VVTSDGLPGIGGHRYEGYSLETKYGWLQQGHGPAAVTEGADFLARLAGDFAESERTIRTALGRLGVSWSGTAAEQATAALRSVADWARGSAVSSAGGSATIGEYGESFARLRSRVAEPPSRTWGSGPGAVPDGLPDAVPPDFGAVGGLQADYRRRLAAYQRLDRAANDALYAHEAQSRAAVRAFPVPQAPPAVATVTVAAGKITGYGSGQVGAPGQRGSDQGTDATVQVSAPTEPAAAQPPAADLPTSQSPTTVPAAGGVARAGGAVPDPGLPGDGQGKPLGVDPDGVLGGLTGVGGDVGGRHSDRWTRPALPGTSGPAVGDGWAERGHGGYSGHGGTGPRGVSGFAGPGGEVPGAPSGARASGGPVGPGRPGQPAAWPPGVGQGGAGQGGMDFDLPDGGRPPEQARGAGRPGRGESRPGQFGQPGRVGYGRDDGRARHGSGFLPGDEPFAVDCDDVPAVLGLPDSDEPRW
jgi:hypothetical protein